MKITDKLKKCRAERERRRARIAEDKAAIAALNKEIQTLEALDIQYLLQEVRLPLDEVKSVIRGMADHPTHEEKDEKEKEAGA